MTVLFNQWDYFNNIFLNCRPGEIKDLLSDIAELKPTIFPAVPRVLNKVYDKVNAQLETQPALLKVSTFKSSVNARKCVFRKLNYEV